MDYPESRKPPKPRKPRTRKLTVRQLKLVQAVIDGKKQREAGLAAGYSSRYKVRKVLKLPHVAEFFRQSMSKIGLTPRRLANEIKRGLDRGELSRHGDYLKLALQTTGVISPVEDQGQHGDKMSLSILICQERERRGLDPIPGVIDIPSGGDSPST